MGKKNQIREAIRAEKEIEIVTLRDSVVEKLDISDDDVLEIEDVEED
jgi:hypothetical protein